MGEDEGEDVGGFVVDYCGSSHGSGEVGRMIVMGAVKLCEGH